MQILTTRTLGSIGCVIAGAVALGGPHYCYFLESSDCGSSGTFCAEDSIVCDVGYQRYIDTGCGRTIPFLINQPRSCWQLSNTLTQSCDLPPPADERKGTGCATGSGICCYAELEWVEDLPGQYMSVPNGFFCCDVVAGP